MRAAVSFAIASFSVPVATVAEKFLISATSEVIRRLSETVACRVFAMALSWLAFMSFSLAFFLNFLHNDIKGLRLSRGK